MRIDLLIEQLQLRFLLLQLHLIFVHDETIQPAGHIVSRSDQHTDFIVGPSLRCLRNAVARLVFAHKKSQLLQRSHERTPKISDDDQSEKRVSNRYVLNHPLHFLLLLEQRFDRNFVDQLLGKGMIVVHHIDEVIRDNVLCSFRITSLSSLRQVNYFPCSISGRSQHPVVHIGQIDFAFRQRNGFQRLADFGLHLGDHQHTDGSRPPVNVVDRPDVSQCLEILGLRAQLLCEH
ncbi:hypothetical protein D3C73_770010 [compost metagenome]